MMAAIDEECESLVRLWVASGLSAWEFAAAIGVDPTTVERHLSGRRAARARRCWYSRVKSVTRQYDDIVIVVRRVAPTRKNVAFWWRRGLTRDPLERR